MPARTTPLLLKVMWTNHRQGEICDDRGRRFAAVEGSDPQSQAIPTDELRRVAELLAVGPRAIALLERMTGEPYPEAYRTAGRLSERGGYVRGTPVTTESLMDEIRQHGQAEISPEAFLALLDESGSKPRDDDDAGENDDTEDDPETVVAPENVQIVRGQARVEHLLEEMAPGLAKAWRETEPVSKTSGPRESTLALLEVLAPAEAAAVAVAIALRLSDSERRTFFATMSSRLRR